MNLSHNERVNRSASRWAREIIDNAACRLADPDLELACRAMRLACSRADNCGQHLKDGKDGKDGSGICIDCGRPT